MTRSGCALMVLAGLSILAAPVFAGDITPVGNDLPTSFALLSTAQPIYATESREIDGPIRPFQMLAADVQAVGTFDLKIIADYATTSNGTDDDFTNLYMAEWGFMENHELLLMVPVWYFDGTVDGNADIIFGWQWKLWDQNGLIPATAVYNQLRVPTGYRSSGLDYDGRAVMTWSLIPDELRLHANAVFTVRDTDNIEANINRNNRERDVERFGPYKPIEARHFSGGGIVGFDWKFSEKATAVIDYIFNSGVLNGYSFQHSAEAGIGYQIAENQQLIWSTRWTLDGDSQGDNWGFTLAYVITLDAPSLMGGP